MALLQLLQYLDEVRCVGTMLHTSATDEERMFDAPGLSTAFSHLLVQLSAPSDWLVVPIINMTETMSHYCW